MKLVQINTMTQFDNSYFMKSWDERDVLSDWVIVLWCGQVLLGSVCTWSWALSLPLPQGHPEARSLWTLPRLWEQGRVMSTIVSWTAAIQSTTSSHMKWSRTRESLTQFFSSWRQERNWVSLPLSTPSSSHLMSENLPTAGIQSRVCYLCTSLSFGGKVTVSSPLSHFTCSLSPPPPLPYNPPPPSLTHS